MDTQNKKESVSVSGLILNMNDTGFTPEACLKELADDSIGAGATHLIFDFTTGSGILRVIDNGKGMTRMKLQEAHTLHLRSDRSDSRQGRFGIGNKHAKVGLTDCQFATRVISKCQTSTTSHEHLSEIENDWPTAVKDGVYENNAHPASVPAVQTWEKFAIQINEPGTITEIPCAPHITKLLTEKFKFPGKERTTEITKSLFYSFGYTYYKFLENGRITIRVDGQEKDVQTIDPLAWNLLADAKKTRYAMSLRKNAKGEYRVYIHEGAKPYYYKNSRADAKQNYDQAGFNAVGEFTLFAAHSSTWSEQEQIYSQYQEMKSQQQRKEVMGGLYMQRNDKIISRTPLVKPGKGDHKKQDCTIESRFIVQFSSSLDDHFKVQVNKSKIELDLINEAIMSTLTKLQKDFVNAHTPKKQLIADISDSDDEVMSQVSSSIASTASSKSSIAPLNVVVEVPQPPVPKPKLRVLPPKPPVVPKEDTVVQQLKVQEPQQPQVEAPAPPVEPPVVVQQEVKPRSPSPEVAPPKPPVTQQVRATTRTVSQSERDILLYFQGLLAEFPPEVVREKLEKADSQTKEGNVAILKSLTELRSLLQKL
jgi:hypothetical protein